MVTNVGPKVQAKVRAALRLIASEYEQAAWQQGLTTCGIDEVGRGCLAGPVVIGAVILHPGASHVLLRDSKTLSPEQREEAYDWIIQHSWYAVAVVGTDYIQRHNIYQATLCGMRKALAQVLAIMPRGVLALHSVLVDAMPLRYPLPSNVPIHYWPKGEDRSISVAAASIVAKVTRDRLMVRMAALFPAYGFQLHKGYATAYHIQALLTSGLSVVHRPAFCLTATKNVQDVHEQQALF